MKEKDISIMTSSKIHVRNENTSDNNLNFFIKNTNWEFNNLAELKTHYEKLEGTHLEQGAENAESTEKKRS